jgi:Arm domain-containing DNA-binding protein
MLLSPANIIVETGVGGPQLLACCTPQFPSTCLRGAYAGYGLQIGEIRMTKLSKRIVDAAEARDKDYVIWDDELPGFGLPVFASGKRSYLIQYRAAGRSRRYTIGQHGVWTPELARKEAKVQLGRVAQGDNPAEEGQLRATTMRLVASQIIGKRSFTTHHSPTSHRMY